MMDDRLLRELYDTYYKFVSNLAANRLFAHTGSTAEVQDVVQEVFLLAAQREIYDHPNPGGWLAVTTNNICKNRGTAAKRRGEKLQKTVDEKHDGNQTSLHLVEASGDATETVDFELTLKAALSPEDYKIVVDHYIYKCSLADIADEMGISCVALRVRIHRIRNKLKKYFFDM